MFDLTFGLKSAIAGTPLAWGARAIDDRTSLGFLGDRQTWYVDGVPFDREDPAQLAVVKAFSGHINREVLPKVQAAFKALRESYSLPHEERMPSGESCETVLYEDWIVKATANTNGSCGYVYVTVALKPVTRPIAPNTLDEPAEGELIWSCDRRPAVGDTIWHKAEARPATFVGWAAEHDHLFALVEVGGRLTNVMGREWGPLIHLADTESASLAGLLCGDYIVLPGHAVDKPSRWVGVSGGGTLYAKHYPDTTDDDVASLANALPEPARTAAFQALERPVPAPRVRKNAQDTPAV